MKKYKDIEIYTEADFEPSITIYEAQQALESRGVQSASLILFGKRMGGHNIGVGEHTKTVAEIMSAVYQLEGKNQLNAKNDADASGTNE